jgi:AraC-like DNA-binding protein
MPNIARATNSLVLDTGLLTTGNALGAWREFISRQIFPTSVSCQASEPFRGRMEVHSIQENRVIFTQSTAYGAERGKAEIALTRASGLMWLILCTRERARIIHRRHDEVMEPGDVMVLHSMAPYFRFEAKVDMTIFACPDTTISEWSEDLAACAGRVIRPSSFWANLLSANLLTLHPHQLEAARHRGRVQTLTGHLTSMLIETLREMQYTGQAPHNEDYRAPSREQLRDDMVLWLERNHEHSGINAQQLALTFGISLRYLHKVFSSDGSKRSYLATLQNIRLRHATNLLQSYDRLEPGVVSDIAAQCGFSDPGTFRRLFKKSTGLLPTNFLQPGASLVTTLDLNHAL